MALLDLDTPRQRSIAADLQGFNLRAEVTVLEDHEDEMVITQHPVEMGAMMSDHAYKRPPEVRIRVGWSNAYGGYSGYAQAIYAQLLALQLARQPFQLWTGKRYYTNMLVASLRESTDKQTEFVFLADILLRQVFLVQTQTTGNAAGIGAKGQQADPAATSPTTDAGPVQPKAAQNGATPGAPTQVPSGLPNDPIDPEPTTGIANSNGGGAGPVGDQAIQ